MSTRSVDWRDDVDDVDAAIVDGYQSGFPVVERPFRRVGEAIGVSEDEALDRVRELREAGIVRRFGPVLNPPVIGSSTLAAVRAPDERFDEIADVINGYRQVNHNYARDHEWNMWFVVTASSRATRDRIVDEIEERTGRTVLVLPMLTDYYIDLEFPVVNGDRFARESVAPDASGRAGASPDCEVGAPDGEAAGSTFDGEADGSTLDSKTDDSTPDSETDASATRISEEAVSDLSTFEADLLLAIQSGFPLSRTPYGDVAADLDADVADVLAGVERLRERGCIKRIGCVIDHLLTGFDANCMVVWDVPDDELDERGEHVGSLPYVTLCYHRPRRPELDWPYNLFTMIHGRDPEAVDAKVDELAGEHLPVPHERLYSTETLKQTGAQYEELVGRD